MAVQAMSERKTDLLTLSGAETLLREIAVYWARRQKTVRVWIETPSMSESKHVIYSVRSDMVNGLPREMVI